MIKTRGLKESSNLNKSNDYLPFVGSSLQLVNWNEHQDPIELLEMPVKLYALTSSSYQETLGSHTFTKASFRSPSMFLCYVRFTCFQNFLKLEK